MYVFVVQGVCPILIVSPIEVWAYSVCTTLQTCCASVSVCHTVLKCCLCRQSFEHQLSQLKEEAQTAK